jgi:RNA polymerase sigma-70 factor, ECF subfamily
MKQQIHNTQDGALLVMRVLDGEREAFNQLLLRYTSSIAHLSMTLLGETQEAQDVAQEAAIQAFLRLSHLREPARFGTWFHAIAANLARSALRRRHDISLHQLSEDATAEVLWNAASPGMDTLQTSY